MLTPQPKSTLIGEPAPTFGIEELSKMAVITECRAEHQPLALFAFADLASPHLAFAFKNATTVKRCCPHSLLENRRARGIGGHC
jgi:hypothetical protein